MFLLALACALAAPSAEQPWSSILRPAVVVQDSEAAIQPETPAMEDAPTVAQATPPTLAPAKTMKAKSKTVKRSAKPKRDPNAQ